MLVALKVFLVSCNEYNRSAFLFNFLDLVFSRISMELDGRILFLILFVFYCVSGEGKAPLVGAVPHPWRPTKLFVFGDSYAATGNNVASLGVDSDRCWISPYGDTFPGKPTGCFSDGRVLTDFIGTQASLM
ncbi:putative carboxylesterase [Rosa chinensis]|uniref:Putative carboxylesterase n=1 Tax=Rosa chinensis TaxID=74649 RepID=A0A2P6RBP6_ROSCH|nr:putative carboxylesterase [Rosa chinensis]